MVQQVEGPCIFSEEQLQESAQLLFRLGVMLWQQALLFPSNLARLASQRLDKQEEGMMSELQV